MKAAALVDEFFQRTELVRIERTVRRSRSNVRPKSEMVDLSDSIIGESFVVYSYAILLCVVAMLLEVMWRHKRDIWAFRSNPCNTYVYVDVYIWAKIYSFTRIRLIFVKHTLAEKTKHFQVAFKFASALLLSYLNNAFFRNSIKRVKHCND